MEHSDRGRHVTHLVQVWIENDGEHIVDAQAYARQGADVLADHLTEILRQARRSSAPWQTAQELAPNDYDRVDWQGIANDLLSAAEEGA